MNPMPRTQAEWVAYFTPRGHVAAGGAPMIRVGEGPPDGVDPTIPTLVINYHKLWTPYVVGTANALIACGQRPVPTCPAPGCHEDQDLWSHDFNTDANSLMTEWNIHAGASNADMVMFGAQFLRDFQHTVKRAGNVFQPKVRKYCPGLALPEPPPFELQNPIVDAITNANILTKGSLEILGIAANGTLQVVTGVVKAVGDAGGNIVDKGTNLVMWLAIGAAVVGGVYMFGPALRIMSTNAASRS